VHSCVRVHACMHVRACVCGSLHYLNETVTLLHLNFIDL